MGRLRFRLVEVALLALVIAPLTPASCAAQWRPAGSFNLFLVDESTTLEAFDPEQLWRTAWLFLDDSSGTELRGRYTLDTNTAGTPGSVLARRQELTIPPRGSAVARQIGDSAGAFAIVLNPGGSEFITVVVAAPTVRENLSSGYWCRGPCPTTGHQKSRAVILERQIK